MAGFGMRPPARSPGGRPVAGRFPPPPPRPPHLFRRGGGIHELMGGGSGHVPMPGGIGREGNGFRPFPVHGQPGGGHLPGGVDGHHGIEWNGGRFQPVNPIRQHGPWQPYPGHGGPFPGGDPSGPPIGIGGGGDPSGPPISIGGHIPYEPYNQSGGDPSQLLQQLLQGQHQNPYIQHLLQQIHPQYHPLDQMMQGEDVTPQQLGLLRNLYDNRVQQQGMV